MLSDDDIQDYIDDRLEPYRRAMVAAQLLARPDLAAHVDALRRQNEVLKGVGQEVLDEPIPVRLRKAVRRAVAAAGNARSSPRLLAAAVTLLVCLAGGHEIAKMSLTESIANQTGARCVGSCAPEGQVRAV